MTTHVKVFGMLLLRRLKRSYHPYTTSARLLRVVSLRSVDLFLSLFCIESAYPSSGKQQAVRQCLAADTSDATDFTMSNSTIPLAPFNSTSSTDSRQWPEIRQSLWATHVAGLVAYYQLGVITNRNGARRDYQNILLPIVFLFFPLLYLCQMFVSLLLVARNCFWRDYQGLNYYVCGILGMYALRRDHDRRDPCADLVGTWKGNRLLLDSFRPLVRPNHKRRNDTRGIDLIVSIVGLYQTLSTSILYVRRRTVPAAGLLDVDHRIGLMALGASLCSFSYIFLQLTGYNWVYEGYDNRRHGRHARNRRAIFPGASLRKSNESERHLGDSLCTWNKHVYDCALTVGLYILYLRFVRRVMPVFERMDYTRLSFERNDYPRTEISGTLLRWPIFFAYMVVILPAVPLNLQIFWSTGTMRLSHIPGLGTLNRLLITVSCLYVAITTIWSEVEEMKRINDNRLDIWNADWRWKDPWSNFLWPL